MAKSAIERKREQLSREEERRRKLPDSTYPYLQLPFFEWFQNNESYGQNLIGPHLDISQISIPHFKDDTGPHSVDGEVERGYEDDPENSPYIGFKGSIGRAERLVDDLLAVASNLALAINTYKQEQLNERINEIEQSDLSDPDNKKKALTDIVKLRKMLDRLNKMTRQNIYEYKIKDI